MVPRVATIVFVFTAIGVSGLSRQAAIPAERRISPDAAALRADSAAQDAAGGDPWRLSAREACVGPAASSNRCLTAMGAIRRLAWPKILAIAEASGDPFLQAVARMPVSKWPGLRPKEPGAVTEPRPAFGGGARAEVLGCASAGGSPVLYYRHIFKAGGTSIMSNLAELAKGSADPGLNWKRNHDCEKLTAEKQTSGNRAKLFSFVREPIARFISGFSEVSLEDGGMTQISETPGSLEYATNFAAHVVLGWVNLHTASQTEFILGHLLKCPVPFDYVGKLEQFDQNWAAIGDGLGCGQGQFLFNRSLGQRGSSRDPLGTTASMKAILSEEQEAQSSPVAQALEAFDSPLAQALEAFESSEPKQQSDPFPGEQQAPRENGHAGASQNVASEEGLGPTGTTPPGISMLANTHGQLLRQQSLTRAATSMHAALQANDGALKRMLCLFFLPDYIVFEYPLPKECVDDAGPKDTAGFLTKTGLRTRDGTIGFGPM